MPNVTIDQPKSPVPEPPPSHVTDPSEIPAPSLPNDEVSNQTAQADQSTTVDPEVTHSVEAEPSLDSSFILEPNDSDLGSAAGDNVTSNDESKVTTPKSPGTDTDDETNLKSGHGHSGTGSIVPNKDIEIKDVSEKVIHEDRELIIEDLVDDVVELIEEEVIITEIKEGDLEEEEENTIDDDVNYPLNCGFYVFFIGSLSFRQDLEETILERLYGLTEMFPETVRNGTCALTNKTFEMIANTYSMSRTVSWIFFSTTSIMFVPFLLENERMNMKRALDKQVSIWILSSSFCIT